MSDWSVTHDAGRLRDVQDRLRDMGRRDLQRKLRRNVATRARPVVADLRQAVLNVDVQSSRGGVAHPDTSTGLRVRTARAITVSTARKRVRIYVSARKFGPHGATLPKYSDAELNRYRRWRHPVFGRMDSEWVQQTGQPWFFVTIRRHRDGFQRAVLVAVDEALREL